MIRKNLFTLFGFIFAAFFFRTTPAFAQLLGIEDIASNIVTSISDIPGLITALVYLVGIIFVITGLLKIKDHIDNERQTPLRSGFIRLIVGGMCFAFPTIMNWARGTISGSGAADAAFEYDVDWASTVFTDGTALLAGPGALFNFNSILFNIKEFSGDIPGLVTAIAYLLGVILTAIGIIKLKEHVEEPEKTSLKEPVIRLLIAGALFALPKIFSVLYTTIVASGMGASDAIVSGWNIFGFGFSSFQNAAFANLCVDAAVGDKVGDVICMAGLSSSLMPSFITALSYVLGLVFTVWGTLKVRDHVINPQQTKLSEGALRLIAAGALFAMPYVANALQASFMPFTLAAAAVDTTVQAGALEYGDVLACGAVDGLDEAFGCFVNDILTPSHTVLNLFCFIAGLIFIMIGITRLIKSSQDGPRGPGGIGTVTTFAVGGILLSGTAMLTALSASLFGNPQVKTLGTLSYVGGMAPAEIAAAQNIVAATIKFMIIVGLLSFVRGIFILRDSAEGKQASVMSGITHIVGGALAVNLGPVINAVQATLGVTVFGVTFS